MRSSSRQHGLLKRLVLFSFASIATALVPLAGHGAASGDDLLRPLSGTQRFSRINGQVIVNGNLPLGSTIEGLAKEGSFVAQFPDGFTVSQEIRLAAGHQGEIGEALFEKATDPQMVQEAIVRAKKNPSMLDRFFELHPEFKNRNPEIAFRNGFEVFYVSVVGDKGSRSDFATDFSPSETSGETVWKKITSLAQDVGTVKDISIYHNHPEGHPMSPSDIAFASAVANQFKIVVPVYAVIKDRTSIYILSGYGMPAQLGGVIVDPDMP